MFNYRMSSSPTDATSRSFYGPLTSSLPLHHSASTSNFYIPLSSNTVTTNTATAPTTNLSSSIYGLDRCCTSPLPRRRYSIGGLPSSSSIADFLNVEMQENSAATANISNLLNETSRSISRSQSILNRQMTHDMALSSSNICDLLDENIHSEIIKYDLLNELTTTASVTPAVTSTRFTNYYSQPTINNDLLYGCRSTPSTVAPSSYFNNSNARTLYRNRRLLSDDYLLSKPIFSRHNNVNNYNTNTFTPSYLQDDYNPVSSSSLPLNTLSLQTNRLLSHHYASNPCLSQTHTSSHLPYSSSPYYRNYYQSPHHHQQPLPPTRQPSMSSLNRYAYSNYKDFVQPYYRTPSRLDLDNAKSNEIKRQVSFKFDVDTMSMDD